MHIAEAIGFKIVKMLERNVLCSPTISHWGLRLPSGAEAAARFQALAISDTPPTVLLQEMRDWLSLLKPSRLLFVQEAKKRKVFGVILHAGSRLGPKKKSLRETGFWATEKDGNRK